MCVFYSPHLPNIFSCILNFSHDDSPPKTSLARDEKDVSPTNVMDIQNRADEFSSTVQEGGITNVDDMLLAEGDKEIPAEQKGQGGEEQVEKCSATESDDNNALTPCKKLIIKPSSGVSSRRTRSGCQQTHTTKDFQRGRKEKEITGSLDAGDEEVGGSWQCHRCDTSNASARSRCSSCMGWKGGRQGWRYRDEESDEGQDDQCVSKPKRSKFSTRDNKKPSSCIPQAKANGDSTEDSASATAQRCSIKVDREFAKRVAQDSARRSIRQRSAPELFVARPSKSGVGVKDGDEEFLESKTSCSTVAAVTDKRSGSARLKSKDENVEEEDEDSWQCHRCDTSNASTRSRCTSCQGWKWKSGSSHPKSQQRSNDVALDRCMAQLPKVILNDQDFFAQHNSLCEVCGKPGELLCCETCNLVFHTSCTLPKLHKEPPNDWSCSYCCADGVRGGMKNGKKRLEAAKACREMEKTKKKHKKAREKALDSGTKDKERSVKVGVQSGGESSR